MSYHLNPSAHHPKTLSVDLAKELASREHNLRSRAAGQIGDGRDLRAIHRLKLWRAYPSFEQFVESKGISIPTAYRIMHAGDVVEEMLAQFTPDTEDSALRDVLERYSNVKAMIELSKNVPKRRWLMAFRQAFALNGSRPPASKDFINAANLLNILPQYSTAAAKEKRIEKAERAVWGIHERLIQGHAISKSGAMKAGAELHAALYNMGHRKKKAAPAPALEPADKNSPPPLAKQAERKITVL